jgi:hypothetical protein
LSSYTGVDCFWLEPTGRARLALRRFTFSPSEHRPEGTGRGGWHACPQSKYGCNATVDLDDFIRLRFKEEGDYGRVLLEVPKGRRPGHRDPRWPTVCDACAEPFPAGAHWQVNQTEEYERADGGLEYVHSYAGPPGALLHLRWGWNMSRDGQRNMGADGISLGAYCPNGMLWQVDHEATGGGRWTRTGDPRDPPSLTVSPSIVAGDYHGFLQAGRFTDSL